MLLFIRPLFCLLLACFGPFLLSAQFLRPEFGSSGHTMVNFSERADDHFHASAITISGDNQVVLGGDMNLEAVLHKMNKDGTADTAFSSKSYSFFDFGRAGNNRIEETLTDSNGLIVSIGHTTPNISLMNEFSVHSAAVVMRTLPNGEPDLTFGKKGKAIFLRPHLSVWGYSGAIQSDGKIVVACRGNTNLSGVDTWDRILLVRFTDKGIVDSSFGTNGSLLIPNFTGSSTYQFRGDVGIAIQPDGKIILGDIYTEHIFVNGGSGTVSSPAVYRITSQGKIDSSFASNGYFGNRLGFYTYRINTVLVQPDGRILVAGNTLSETNATSWLMFRLLPSGNLDTSFANKGIFTYSEAGWLEQTIGHIQMQGNDRVIAAAVHNTDTRGVLDVFRIHLNGSFDVTFGQNKKIYQQPTDGGSYFSLAKLSLNDKQEIAAMGYSTYNPNRNSSIKGHLVARLSKEGIPVVGFTRFGYKIFNTSLWDIGYYKFGSSDLLHGMARLSSGEIMLGGTVFTRNKSVADISITKLTAQGQPDTSFANKGIKLFRVLPNTLMTAFLPLHDDHLIFTSSRNTLYKIDSNGERDTTFNLFGEVALHFPPVNGSTPTAIGLAEQPDGKILVLSTQQILRLNADGSVDNTFGTAGLVTLSSPWGIRNIVMKLQPDGKIVVGSEEPIVNFLFRCLPDGKPDTTFGPYGNGYAPVHVSILTSYEPGFATNVIDFEFQPDGKVVVLCMKDRAFGPPNITPKSNYRDIILYRLNANGLLDYTFGGVPDPAVYKGTAHLPLPFTEEVPGDLLLAPGGKILIAAYLSNGTGWDVGLLQLKNNGAFDSICSSTAISTSGMDNILQSRFGTNLKLNLISSAQGSYLVAGSQMGENADFFVMNFLPPTSPHTKYTAFNAAKSGSSCFDVNLAWQTSAECAVDSFSVEHSDDKIHFTRLGSVATNGLRSYSFTDKKAVFGNNYYRLRTWSNGSVYGSSGVQHVTIENAPIATSEWQTPQVTARDSSFDVLLFWNTSFEQGSIAFEMQVSTDSVNFTKTTTVPASGHSSVTKLYMTSVNALTAGKYYFRIVLSGDNCRQDTSSVLSVLLKEEEKHRLAIAPVPVHGILTVSIPSDEQLHIRAISIVSLSGSVVKQIKYAGGTKLDVNCSDLPPGTYILQLAGKKRYSEKFIKL